MIIEDDETEREPRTLPDMFIGMEEQCGVCKIQNSLDRPIDFICSICSNPCHFECGQDTEPSGNWDRVWDANYFVCNLCIKKGETVMSELHTMQAAIALSPTNKASCTLENGDILVIQEYEHEKYRMWIVAPGDIPIWSGPMGEKDIDEFPTKFKADPGKRQWVSMGIVPDHTADYQAVETAIQALAGLIAAMRTELIVIKGMILAKKDQGEL